MSDQFAPGTSFPPADSVHRLDQYRYMDRLYKGDQALWKMIANQYDKVTKMTYDASGNARIGKAVSEMAAALDNIDSNKQRFLSFNPMKLIVSKMEQLIFNKPVQIANIPDEPESEYAIRRIIRDNRLNNTGKKLVRNIWIKGDCFLRARVGTHASYKDKEPMVFLDSINPANCFPVYDSSEMASCAVVFPLQRKQDHYLLVETHLPGETRYSGFKMNGEKLSEEITFGGDQWKELWPNITEQVIDTMVDRLLVWHIADGQTDGNFGESKFLPAIPMLADMSKKLGGLSHVHDVAASPKLTIPESMISNHGGGDLEVLVKDVIPLLPGSEMSPPAWVEIVGSSMTITKDYIDGLLDNICFLLSAPRSLLFNNFDGGVESGIAIEKKALSAFLEAQSLINDIREMFSEAIYYAEEIENKKGMVVERQISETGNDGQTFSSLEFSQADYKPVSPDIRIQFSTGNEPNVQNIISKLQAGLMTWNDAYQEANPDVPPSDVDRKKIEIDKEQNNLPQNKARNAFFDNFSQQPNGGNNRSLNGEQFDAENALTAAIQEAQNIGT